MVSQQPEGDDRPGVPATPSVIVEIPLHGEANESGVGTKISGLRPAPSVAADGIVASLNAGPVLVARPGIGETTLLPKAAVAAEAPAVGLHVPVMVDVPKEEMAGGVAPGGSCADSMPVPTAPLASTVLVGTASVIPVVGHVMIVPMALPEIGPKLPRLGWIAPNGFPGLAPTIGIVPGTTAGDVMGMAGDVMRIAGALRGDVDLTCAKVELQPNKTRAAVMRTKFRIGACCV